MNIQELVDKEKENGYDAANAAAKVCQDIVLMAISKSPLSRNVTIKGGVVMRGKTNNKRRATQDMDIDFIRYSLSDESIDLFIEKLNCIEGISISRNGEIMESNQQDYKGKKLYISVKDSEGNELVSKLDLGVHNRLELEQEEFCFDIAYADDGVNLLINSYEQMFAEKLRSLLKFGPLSTRYKDVYDMYYMKDFVNMERLNASLQSYIFMDETMRENNTNDILIRLEKTFKDKRYVNDLNHSGKRWLDDGINDITNGILDFIRNIR